MRILRLLSLVIGLLLCTALGFAQKNEFELTLGNTWSSAFTSSAGIPLRPVSIPSDTNLTYEGGFSRRVADFRLATLSVELTAAGFPTHYFVVTDSTGGGGPLGFGSVFITPGAKFGFLRNRRVSPFGSAGVGLVHIFGGVVPGMGLPSTNAPAFQFGGGVDVKSPWPSLALRAEIRDFLATQSGFDNMFGGASESHRNHVMLGGGAVFRF